MIFTGTTLVGIGVIGFVCSFIYAHATSTEGAGTLVGFFLLLMASEAIAGAGILLVVIDVLWRLASHYRKSAG